MVDCAVVGLKCYGLSMYIQRLLLSINRELRCEKHHVPVYIHHCMYTTTLPLQWSYTNAKLHIYSFALGFPWAAASSNLLLSPPCVTATGASNTVLSGFSLRARASTYSRSPDPRYTCRGRQILTPDGVSICCRQWANHPTQRGTANRTG